MDSKNSSQLAAAPDKSLSPKVKLIIGLLILVSIIFCAIVSALMVRQILPDFGKSAVSVSSTTSKTSSESSSKAPTETEYQLFFYRQSDPKTGEDILNVFPVTRATDRADVVTFLIEQLLIGPATSERDDGYLNAVQLLWDLPEPEVIEFTNSVDANNAFTIELDGATVNIDFKYAFNYSGDFSAGLAREQIRNTLLLVPGVDDVQISVQGDECWDDMSGLCE